MKLAASLVLLALSSLCVATAAEEKWVEVKSPHFTIITSGVVSMAKDWLVEMEAMRSDLNELSPLPDEGFAPLHIVLYSEAEAFNRQFKVKEGPAFSLVVVTKFANRNSRFSCAINDAAGDSAQRSAILEALLCITDAYTEPMPLWLVTGLQEIYGRSVVSAGSVEIGGPVEGSFQSLRWGLRMPMDEMLDMTTNSGSYRRYEAYFNAQAWAFTHYLLLGDKGIRRPMLGRYLSAVQRGAPRDVAAREAFPEGLDTLKMDFEKVAKHGIYRTSRSPVDAATILRSIKARPADEADINLVLGRIYIYSGDFESAESYLQRALTAAPQKPEAYEAFAELAGMRGDEAEMLRQYREAAARGSGSYQAYFYPGLERSKSFLGGEATIDRYDPRQVRETIEAMKQTLRLKPGYPMAYQVIAGLMGSATEIAPGDREAMTTGVKLFPNKPVLRVGLAVCDLQAGHLDEAANKLEALATEVGDGEIAQYITKLQHRIKGIRTLARAEALVAGHKYTEAEAMVPELFQFQYLGAEKARVDDVNRHINVAGLLGRLRQSLTEKDWSMVEIYEQQLARETVPPALAAEHKQLLADLASQRPKP